MVVIGSARFFEGGFSLWDVKFVKIMRIKLSMYIFNKNPDNAF